MARVVAGTLALGCAVALWRHVTASNLMLARFLEALRYDDAAVRFERRDDSGFAALGAALDAVLAAINRDRRALREEVTYREALVDDIAVALLTVDANGRVMPVNKAARHLFRHVQGARAEDYAGYGATFAKRLAEGDGAREDVLLLRFDGRLQRTLVRVAMLDRLGRRMRVVTVQPIQGTLDAVEMAAQTDIVRVLTHEILNSLTPVTSLAATAAQLLDGQPPAATAELADARLAVATLARRAQGLTHFIESYRSIARAPVVDRARFAIAPLADELARLFAADWPQVALTMEVVPERLTLDADRALLAQALINLMRNAGEAASAHAETPRVAVRFVATPDEAVAIEVCDNGPGVPPTLRGDIFLPFFTTRKTGTGVGLNLTRQIVIAHGGTIDIADAEGGGALFQIVI